MTGTQPIFLSAIRRAASAILVSAVTVMTLFHYILDQDTLKQRRFAFLLEAKNLSGGGSDQISFAQQSDQPSVLQHGNMAYAAQGNQVIGQVQRVLGFERHRGTHHNVFDQSFFAVFHCNSPLRELTVEALGAPSWTNPTFEILLCDLLRPLQ